MKKLMVFAMAAMVALASCTKTELVDNSAPTPISLKAVTGKMTKAEQTSNNFLQDLGVIAYVHNTSDLYFDNAKFIKKSETVTNDGGGSSTVTYWDGGKYWPFESSLNFVVYSPYNAATTYNYANSTLSVSNVNITPDLGDDQLLDMGDQIDYLYGSEYFKGIDEDSDQLPDGYDKNSGNVATTLKHASAKLTLSFKGSDVVIKSVSIKDAVFEGSYVVTYPTGVAVWDYEETQNVTKLNWESAPLTNEPTENSISVMVVPTTAPDVKIRYRITGTQTDLDANITLSDQLVAGCEHTYVITVTPRAIQFGNPSINGWGTGTATNPPTIN